MDYLLILLLCLIIQSDAQEKQSEPSRVINDDSFDVNIGAGYGVGPYQPSESLPRSTMQIVRTRDHPPNDPTKSSARSIREPRILTNFTPSNSINTNAQAKSQNRIYDFTHFDSPPSNGFEDNSLNNYQVHESLADDDKHLNIRPNLIQLQKFISGVDKPNSKIVEVIKVPAVYEIHLQTDSEKGSHKNSVSGALNHDSFLKTYGKHKPIFEGFSTKFSDESIKWLQNYYKKKEEAILKESEKFKDQRTLSDLDFPENFDETQPEWHNDNLGNALEPVLAHHYKHVGSFENKHDKDEVHHKTDPTNKLRYTPWQAEDHSYDKNIHYGTNNYKRDAGLSSYKSSPTPFRHMMGSNYPPTKKSLEPHKINNKLDSLSKLTEFKRNQEFTEFSQPQALHEVPAPYLGKYPRPKGFIEDTSSKLNDFVPQHISNQPNVLSTLPSNTSAYYQGRKSLGLSYNQVRAETKPITLQNTVKPKVVDSAENFIPSVKGNQNFIYGKRTEPVLSPNEINTEITTKDDLIDPDNYRRSDYNDISSVNPIQNSNSNVLNTEDKKCSNCEMNVDNIAVTTPAPDENNMFSSQNNSNTFNKKSDNIYSESHQKKDLVTDNIMDSWDISKPMTPVYKNSIYSIYPKKVFDGKKNLLHNVYSTDFKRNVMYSSPLKENMFFQSNKSQNQSKQVKPLGYVIYITKKSTEEK